MKVLPIAIAAITLLISSSALALGANSDKNLKRFTASQVTRDTKTLIEPESIKLKNVKRGIFRVSWQADTPNGIYACDGDDMMRNASCVRLETPAKAPSPQ